MISVEYKGRKVNITYRNDVIFKMTLGSDDDESRELLKFVVEAVTNRKFRTLRVVNTESLGRFVLDKKNFLDIRAEDEEGNITNIEMQCSDIGEFDIKRFQGYVYRLAGNQLKSGDDYGSAGTVDQIVFTTGYFNGKLITEYKQREKNGKIMPYNMASFYFISLPEIEKIVEEKKKRKEKLNDLEVLSYVYQKEVDDDIISVSDERQKRMITLMDKKYKEAAVNEEVFDEVKEAAFYEAWLNAQLKHSLQKGYDDGMAQGMSQGIAQGLTQGKISIMVNYVLNKFDEDITSWLSQLDDQQLMLVEEHIFKVKSIEELMNII